MKTQKEPTNNKVKIDVDFKTPGNSANYQLLFDSLIQYNGVGKSYYTASMFVQEAFINYNPVIGNELLKTLENEAKIDYLTSNYHLNCKEDFVFHINNDVIPEPAPLKEPYKRMFVVDLSTEEGKSFYATMKGIRLRDRAFMIYEYVRQYVILTRNERYIQQASRHFFSELSNLYKYTEKSGSNEAQKTFECAVTAILRQKRKEYTKTSERIATVAETNKETYACTQEELATEVDRIFGRTQKKIKD